MPVVHGERTHIRGGTCFFSTVSASRGHESVEGTVTMTHQDVRQSRSQCHSMVKQFEGAQE